MSLGAFFEGDNAPTHFLLNFSLSVIYLFSTTRTASEQSLAVFIFDKASPTTTRWFETLNWIIVGSSGLSWFAFWEGKSPNLFSLFLNLPIYDANAGICQIDQKCNLASFLVETVLLFLLCFFFVLKFLDFIFSFSFFFMK